MTRQEFSKRIKVAAFERSNGKCEVCTARLYPGKFHFDHIRADGLGGEPTLQNCACLCTACHSAKSGTHDKPKMAKADRAKAAHLKAKTRKGRPMMGSRSSGWRKRMDGTAERR